MRPMLRRCVIALTASAIVAVSFLSTSFMSATSANGAGAAGGRTFRVGVLSDAASLDVARDTSALASEVWTLQYPRLTEYDATDVTPIPGLADSWSPSSDGLTYTYRLRGGLNWSDGTPLTSADVVASINGARTGHWPGTGDLSGLSARAAGPLTVVVHASTLNQQLPSLPVHVVPKGDTSKLSIGSGPFVVWQRKPGFVRMVANDRYYGGRPFLDAVEFHVYPNGDALAAAIQRGDVDAVSGVPSNQFDKLNSNENVTTVVGNNGDYYALALDTRAAPLSDVRVRQALGFFVDRALLVQRYNNGVGRAAVTPTLARSTTWDFSLKVREQVEQQIDNDAGKARGLLRASGADRIDLAIGVAPNDAAGTRIVATLADVMRGTPVHVAAAGAGGTSKVNAQLVLRVPGDDPDAVLRSFTCAANQSWWCDPAYQRMYAAESTSLDPAFRVATVRDMKRLLIAQSPEVPLFHTDRLEAYRSDRWKNVVRQPLDTGAAFFTLSAPTFVLIQQASQLGTNKVSAQATLLAALAVAAIAVAALVAYFIVRARGSLRRTAPT
ncbi:MAG: hypothetical protein JWL83_1580 [Actinomycetia bacterium]|nr:hypothetical protein [Actinomycetes bacterium]